MFVPLACCIGLGLLVDLATDTRENTYVGILCDGSHLIVTKCPYFAHFAIHSTV
jgi:hypothetical protein